MGYVEVGGNGSVVWFAKHDKGKDGNGHKGGGWGHDEEPAHGTGARFVLMVNGTVVDTPTVDDTRILILWGSHSLIAPEDSAQDGSPVHPGKVGNRFKDLPKPL